MNNPFEAMANAAFAAHLAKTSPEGATIVDLTIIRMAAETAVKTVFANLVKQPRLCGFDDDVDYVKEGLKEELKEPGEMTRHMVDGIREAILGTLDNFNLFNVDDMLSEFEPQEDEDGEVYAGLLGEAANDFPNMMTL